MDWVNAMHKTNNKFKFQLFGRAIDNLDRLYVKVQQYDPEGSGGMSAQAFNLFLNGGSVFLSTQ